MIKAILTSALSVALIQLKNLIALNEEKGKRTVVFCEDRLTLAAEKTVCAAVAGTFNTSVYTFARFLAAEGDGADNILTSQGSAMAIRKIIDDNRDNLKLFKRLNTATAAQDVYDTIALLYSSRVTAEDIKGLTAPTTLLAQKLTDLSFLYEKYSEYLRENNCMDRNSYLRRLPDVIENSDKIMGADVIFLGFQSFTCSVAECCRACMDAAKNVHGIFIGGDGDIYTNEAIASFEGVAKSFGGCQTKTVPSTLCEEAEILRRNLFNPECFHKSEVLNTDKITLFEASDEEDEINFVASRIIKHVSEGERYQSISVMVPDVKGYQRTIERVFAEYDIPCYLDRRYALIEHPLSAFILDYLNCAADGCTQDSVFKVVSSPIFTASRKDKDIFTNYMLRLAAYSGGVKRQPKEEILSLLKFDGEAVERVRALFLKGLKILPAKGNGHDFCGGISSLLTLFAADKTLEKQAEDFKDEYPSRAALSARAYSAALSVTEEAEKLVGGSVVTVREFAKILKSGLTAMEISLIPPKQDAVFVGDLDATSNTGTMVLFAVGMTDAVPGVTQDAAILSDRELAALENLSLVISPKIEQVNRRSRELTALNICAFEKHLYITYPSRRMGDECAPSLIISYIRKLFATNGGMPVSAINSRLLSKSDDELAYLCSHPLPALKMLSGGNKNASTIYALLNDNGYGELCSRAMAKPEADNFITCGKQLYGTAISPTTLENYFSCPYKSFMRQGIRAVEREEGVMRPLDSGNFIHTVLQKLAYDINDIDTPDALAQSAQSLCENLLAAPQYSTLTTSKRGQYTATALTEEAVEVSLGMYEQLKNSRFKVSAAEKKCDVILDGGVKLYGRIDRVDECGDMVRIIDYKTGTVDSSAASYYMGQKLQLPLYLLSASRGKRAVGAYYFPAQVEYKDKVDGVFRLKGFMDGSEDVVRLSDTAVQEKAKSNYFDAYLNGRKLDYAMDREEFACFLSYAYLVSRKGASELIGGNIAPSPAEGACLSCKFAGSCGFAAGSDGEERKALKVNCAKIAQIAKDEGEGK